MMNQFNNRYEHNIDKAFILIEMNTYVTCNANCLPSTNPNEFNPNNSLRLVNSLKPCKK